jgi:hypothetical protein
MSLNDTVSIESTGDRVTGVRIRCGGDTYIVRPTFDGPPVVALDGTILPESALTEPTKEAELFELRAEIVPGVTVLEYYQNATAANTRTLEIQAAAFAAKVTVTSQMVDVTDSGYVVIGTSRYKVH